MEINVQINLHYTWKIDAEVMKTVPEDTWRRWQHGVAIMLCPEGEILGFFCMLSLLSFVELQLDCECPEVHSSSMIVVDEW